MAFPTHTSRLSRIAFLLLALAASAHAEPPAGSAEMVDASHVRLLPGSPFYDRQELHRTGYVGRLDPDRLLFEYRKLAGLPQPAGITAGYGSWDSGFIRGHMAGHYLSAASRMAAATGDDSFRKKAAYLVAELAKCQQALKQDGYLAAFPSVALDWQEGASKNSGGVVVPYYTLHKIMAGLVDAHHYLGNKQALDVALKLSAYLQKRLLSLPPDQIERMFRTDQSRNPQTEFGGMADVLSELYAITGDKKQLELAALFNRPWLIDPLAANEDRLKSLHANTHVAQLAGIARYANLTGDAADLRASENFWAMVTRHHSFAIGGNSYKEWFDAPDVEAGPSINDGKRLPPTTAESCNTQNMLKLTARLIERTPGRAYYADYFERALYNHLLATIAPDTGAMTYFTPLHGDFRTYLDGTHCCVGSGIENTARYNEGIYFQHPGHLWVNLYIPSALDWTAQGLAIKQEGFPPFTDTVRLTVVRAARPAESTLHLRVPGWLSGPVALSINGRPQPATAKPSSYLAVKRVWQTGDVVTLKLPSALRLERAKDVPSMISVFYGPLLLAGRLGHDGMTGDFADKDAYLKLPPAPVPAIINAAANPSDWLTLADASTLTFKTHDVGPASGIVFQPLYAVHHERYSVYWELADAAAMASPTTPAPNASAKEATSVLDRVIIGDTDSERAHDLSAEQSLTGHVANYSWRDAAPNGAFSYVLALPTVPKSTLICTYWGSDRDRTFDIVVNGVVVATQTLEGRQPGKAIEVAYPLPPESLTGQQNLTVRFQGSNQGRVGGLFGLRLEATRP
ncbi:MAG: beta-L-arabinofuranosidase domain-containing protein [Chthoniobacterales bacterium]